MNKVILAATLVVCSTSWAGLGDREGNPGADIARSATESDREVGCNIPGPTAQVADSCIKLITKCRHTGGFVNVVGDKIYTYASFSYRMRTDWIFIAYDGNQSMFAAVGEHLVNTVEGPALFSEAYPNVNPEFEEELKKQAVERCEAEREEYIALYGYCKK